MKCVKKPLPSKRDFTISKVSSKAAQDKAPSNVNSSSRVNPSDGNLPCVKTLGCCGSIIPATDHNLIPQPAPPVISLPLRYTTAPAKITFYPIFIEGVKLCNSRYSDCRLMCTGRDLNACKRRQNVATLSMTSYLSLLVKYKRLQKVWLFQSQCSVVR